MATKIINITVPLNWREIEIMNTLSAEENAFILNTGCEIIKEARSFVTGLSEKEIYNKIREESKIEIEKLELDLLVEKGLNSNLEKSIRTIYESQIDQLNKKFENALSQIEIYKQGNSISLYQEIDKVKEKYDLIYREKEKQVDKLSDTYEKMIVQLQTTKSTSHKGSEGEKQFEDYAETFIDFKGFNIIDKHTQGGEGDFHLHFEEFDILVDAKNYKKKVPIDQREKIKKDLQKNEHMHFGWLVSLNTSIDKFDKAPVMYEWINTKQCIVYINNLTEYEDPRKILRVVWFTCKELYKFVQEIKVDTEELQELKNNKFKLMDKIKNMRKIMREINTTLNTTRNMLQQIDDEFKELLSSETEKIVESNYSIFDNWWYTNIELTNEENKLLSTDLWLKFKQDNKKTMSEFDVTTDKFKQYLKTKIPMTSIILKNKNMNSAFEIKGIKWKYIKTEEEPILELSLVNEMSNNKIKKKIKSPEVYFNEKLDKKIIEYYNTSNEDIITIANKYNVKTFEIVSLLVRYKIISKRSESRGYDKYKDSEDYKSKLNI